MAAKAKKKERKLSGESIRFIIYLMLAAVCIALFLIFGKSGRSIPSSASPSQSPVSSPSAIPKGITMGRFIDSLAQSGMDCSIGKVLIGSDGAFEYPLTLPDGREGARLVLKTDAIGRVTEAIIELQYEYAGEPDSSFSEITSAAIKAEYRRRENADCALIKAYLESIYAQLGEDCKITTIDIKKIADSIESAYFSRKTYDKKAGSARFYCETESAEDDEFLFTFRLIASFDYSK